MDIIRNNLTAKIRGGQIPQGKVRVSGAKNASTRLLAAALISDEEVTLSNFPTQLVDAQYKIDFIRKSGGNITVDTDKEELTIDSGSITSSILEDYNYPIRTTYLLVPGLIKKTGIARIPYPGGCKIGDRGYDLHMMVWEKLGATITEKENYIEVSAPSGFTAGEIDFPISTIGGTENALISASIAVGETVIKNAYISPEVNSLIDFLKRLGVHIEVVGNSFIKVKGTKYLRGTLFPVIPDRIEAITWIVYGIISGGNITIEDVPFDMMEIPLIHLKHAGIEIYRNSNNVIISPECLVNGDIQPFELACGTHPGIISDMQPFYTLLGLHANGISRIFDYRYPERIKYCEELNKFYPKALDAKAGTIKIFGGKEIIPAEADSTDLRGSMAVVMAALLAKGESTINNVEMALRGYNNLEDKLKNLGVEFKVISNQ
ncbi:UDP-N-acetylglucosamine 1-carboxyvinyltransferase [Epilithonimonas ginsengisoli]|uniref:UDP-N-acetylglucosamine 1-carboxyvinyltransferase n=1 Tax=Epilithonimonas ginsengisoli TaxID=1245592 RepID=A0ABU4JIM9_9FLAO|nr:MULTISPECIES: UDP-N-acetylglucosamine 1-carboxyvinyltransferase [Chryseobacterium group]MBV6879091.1 UDP-N-acetylglucosamine 1-carboxyvinyltransferase [Epilithonimonas sp. FP105]MDW8549525.1 UDP-N-acetylglucosamine 1-carboxyvinyltransferase [Epilithonimonas ginsengisoli]